MTSEAVSRALLGVIILESLEEKETKNKRGKTRQWIQRREEKGFYTNNVEELWVEDIKTYEKMLRMNYDTFKFILKEIKQGITPIALMSGGLKTISPGERLTLTLRYLATGESHRSLSFQSRISHNNIVHNPGGLQSNYQKSIRHLLKNTRYTKTMIILLSNSVYAGIFRMLLVLLMESTLLFKNLQVVVLCIITISIHILLCCWR